LNHAGTSFPLCGLSGVEFRAKTTSVGKQGFFRTYRQRTLVGITLMAAQAFFYNVAGMLIAAPSAFAAEVTSDRLLNADREPQNWLMNHRTGETANANLVAGSNLAICRREVEAEQFWPLAGPDIHRMRTTVKSRMASASMKR
jgi:hypothetical protein